MNITQSDEILLSGEWHGLIQDIIDAMRRHRDSGQLRKGSLLYNKWTERIALLEEAIEI